MFEPNKDLVNCPECGEKVEHFLWTMIPPTAGVRCPKCGWSDEKEVMKYIENFISRGRKFSGENLKGEKHENT